MGEDIKAVAGIQILLTPDGRVLTNVQGQGLTYVAILGMLEVAKANIVEKHQREAAKPKLVMSADPLMAARFNGTAR